jgi:hypothetical protein
MPGSGAGAAQDPDSLLPRGFPTLDELAECETAEEKEELCEKADLLVERLEAKADSAEAFVDGPICGFFGFLKPNAIRNAEKARAAAEEAAAAAAELRRKAKGGAGNATVAAGAAVLVLAGAAAVVLGGGVDGVVTQTRRQLRGEDRAGAQVERTVRRRGGGPRLEREGRAGRRARRVRGAPEEVRDERRGRSERERRRGKNNTPRVAFEVILLLSIITRRARERCKRRVPSARGPLSFLSLRRAAKREPGEKAFCREKLISSPHYNRWTTSTSTTVISRPRWRRWSPRVHRA